MNENCSASNICVSFSSSSTTQDNFYLKIRLCYGQRQFGKKKNNEKAAIKSQKHASQTGNRGSVSVRNVNEGTLELKKKDTGNYLFIKYCNASCLLQWLYG